MGEESIILEKSGSQMESQMEVDDNKEVSELTDEQLVHNISAKPRKLDILLTCKPMFLEFSIYSYIEHTCLTTIINL